MDICSLLRAVATSSAAASAAKEVKSTAASSKEAPKDISKIYITKVKSACSRSASIAESSVSELVVLFPLFIITKYCISLRSLFKLSLRLLITRIGIRMILLSKHSVRFLQFISRRILSNTKNLIIISFLICHIYPTFINLF